MKETPTPLRNTGIAQKDRGAHITLRSTYTALGIAAIVVLAALPLGPASSDGILRTGSFPLEAAGLTGSSFEIPLSPRGPLGAGDTVRFVWSADGGQGPLIHFEIQALSADAVDVMYEVLAHEDAGTFEAPAQGEYAAFWGNPSLQTVMISYELELLRPPPPMVEGGVSDRILIFVAVALLGAALGYVLLSLWLLRRKNSGSGDGRSD